MTRLLAAEKGIRYLFGFRQLKIQSINVNEKEFPG